MPITSSLEISPDNRDVLFQIVNSPDATRRGIRNALYLSGKALRKFSRDLIKNPPKTGAYYRIPGRKRLHRASAPGQPPANRTGKLRESVGFEVKGSSDMRFGVRTDVNYGKFLERGTKIMSKSEFLIRSINENQKDIENYFNGNVNKELNKLP